jgi:hypothetical protein
MMLVSPIYPNSITHHVHAKVWGPIGHPAADQDRALYSWLKPMGGIAHRRQGGTSLQSFLEEWFSTATPFAH